MKAKQKFCGHQSSGQDRFAVSQLASLKAPSSGCQLGHGKSTYQLENLSSKYLARCVTYFVKT